MNMLIGCFLGPALSFWTIVTIAMTVEYIQAPQEPGSFGAFLLVSLIQVGLSAWFIKCMIKYYSPEYQEKMKKAQEDWEKYQAGAAERRQLREKYELEKTAKQPTKKKTATERGKDLATLGCIGAILYFPIGVILALAKKYSK